MIAANSQPRMRARSVLPYSAAAAPTSTALPSVNRVIGRVARLPARPALPAARPITKPAIRAERSDWASSDSGGGGVSASPSMATAKTASAAWVVCGQPKPSDTGAIRMVTAMPGSTTGIARAGRPPENASAASPAATVSSSAESTLDGVDGARGRFEQRRRRALPDRG